MLFIIITSTSDLQPSTAVANQLPGHLVSTQIRTIGLNCFIFIHSIDSSYPAQRWYKELSDFNYLGSQLFKPYYICSH